MTIGIHEQHAITQTCLVLMQLYLLGHIMATKRSKVDRSIHMNDCINNALLVYTWIACLCLQKKRTTYEMITKICTICKLKKSLHDFSFHNVDWFIQTRNKAMLRVNAIEISVNSIPWNKSRSELSTAKVLFVEFMTAVGTAILGRWKNLTRGMTNSIELFPNVSLEDSEEITKSPIMHINDFYDDI